MRASLGQVGYFMHRDQALTLRDDLVYHWRRAVRDNGDPAGRVILANVGHGQTVDIITA